MIPHGLGDLQGGVMFMKKPPPGGVMFLKTGGVMILKKRLSRGVMFLENHNRF